MIVKDRKCTIMWRSDPSYFKKANESNLDEPKRYLGSSTSAVNAMLAKGELLRTIMPKILGIDPTSTDSNWSKSLKNYWDSLTVPIRPEGKELNIGFQYDMYSSKPAVVKLVEDKIIKSDAELLDYVEGTKVKGKQIVDEDHKFMYGDPIVPEDYVLWLYTFNYRDVANTLESVNDSKSIRFYIMYDGDFERIKRQAYMAAKEANEMFIKVSKDENLMNDMIYLLDGEPSQFGDITDKEIYLKAKSETESERFVTVANDKNLTTKATIERLIKAGVLNRLPNTEIVVDATDPDFIIGNTLQEVILFFLSDALEKSKKVKEFKTKLNSINIK